MKKILFAMMACAGLCACSDEVDLGSSTTKVFQNDKAYITVSISDVGSSSTRATSSGFDQSPTTAENNIADIHFYFYDGNGNYMSKGEVVDETWNGDGVSENVEKQSDIIVVLDGLAGKDYPKYMVTVLNQPDNFYPGTNLDRMEAVLSNDATYGIYDADKNFVMSTSSYFNATRVINGSTGGGTYAAIEDGGDVIRPYDYVTNLEEDNFIDEPVDLDDAKNNPVQVYVERLAAKVSLQLGDFFNGDNPDIVYIHSTDDGSDHYCISIDETIGGDENNEEVDDAAEKLVVRLDGWRLNAAAKNSYILKNIQKYHSTWKNGYAGQGLEGYLGEVTDWSTAGWNDATNHRSYWGASYNYGIGSTSNDFKEYLTYSNLSASSETDYNPLNTIITTANTPTSTYCAENTNTAIGNTGSGVITSKYSPAITNVMIKATLLRKDAEDDNYSPVTLIRYHDMLWEPDDFLNYLAEDIGIYADAALTEFVDGTKFFRIIQDGEGNYTDGDYNGDGYNDGVVKVEYINNDPDKGGEQVGWYTESTGYRQASVNPLTNFTNADGITYANATYTCIYNGLMYYLIPIQHLNNYTKSSSGSAQNNLNGTILEANYGVVRNHHYNITINSLTNVGHGMISEDDPIIPDDVYEDEDAYYYVGANINILSFKDVEQGVDL